MNPNSIALTLAIPLILLGVGSGYFQVLGRRVLHARKHVPSDEFAYLNGRYRRRLLAAGLMVLAGSLIAGAYLGGVEARADALAAPNADGTKKDMSPEDRQFIRFYGLYWIGVILLAFVLVCVAIVDAWATRRYWLSVYKLMKEDHQTLLRRDLAIYKQDKDQRRGRDGWRGRDGGEGQAGDFTPPGAL